MNWFQDGIGAAIASAKAKQAIFTVVVKSPPDAEQEETVLLESVLQEDEVISCLSRMVCICVDAGSTTCAQFAAIYPVMVVPAVYFIDSSTGVDLEITGGKVTKDSLLASIKRAEDRLASNLSQPQPAPAQAPVAAAAAPVAAVEVPAAAAAVEVPLAAPVEATTSATGPLEERVARAKMLMQQRQIQKDQEEEDKEKNQEMERRKLGQVLQEQKRNKEETELKKAALERRKDKEEEKKAREAIKAKIEEDRLERKMKYETDRKETDDRRKEAERATLAATAAAAEVTAAERASIARIQFKLPDGRNQTKQFSADSPISELYTFVETSIETGFSTFSLSTTFPRRQLDLEPRGRTLRELMMAPSATVLVIPKASTTSMALPGDGSLMAFIWLLLTPFTLLWTMLSSLLPTDQTPPPSSSASNRPGGIGRLRRSEKDDDENNTYNGNSTQQM